MFCLRLALQTLKYSPAAFRCLTSAANAASFFGADGIRPLHFRDTRGTLSDSQITHAFRHAGAADAQQLQGVGSAQQPGVVTGAEHHSITHI